MTPPVKPEAQGIPDFSDIFAPKPKVDSTVVKPDSVGAPGEIPTFTDIFTPKPVTGPWEEEIKPRLKGIWGGAKTVGDFGMNLFTAATVMPQLMLAAVDPALDPLKERRAMLRQQSKAALVGIGDGIKKGVLDPSTIPPAIGDLLHGMIVTPAQDLAKFLYSEEPGSGGVSFSAGKVGDYQPATYPTHLKPEQIEEATKQTTAIAASIYIGGLVTTEITAGMSGLKPFVKGKGLTTIAKAASPAEIEAIVSDAVPRRIVGTRDLSVGTLFDMNKAGTLASMPWAQRTIAKLGGDVAGGFTYGYMSAPDDQRVSSAIAMAIVAAPLGMIHAGISESRRVWKGSGIDNFQIARETAFNMASAREWNGIWNKTPAAIFEDLDVLQQVKLLQSAQARNLVTYKNIGFDENGIQIRQGENAGIIPGVSLETLPEVLKQTVSEPGRADVTTFIHPRGDGFHDVYIGPTDTPLPVKDFFEKTGFIQGQPVTYGGNERMMIDTAERGANGEYTMTLFDPVTELRTAGVKPSDVIRPSNKYIGELALYQNKKLTMADMIDPAMGISLGENKLTIASTRTPINLFHEHVVNTTLASLPEYELVFDKKGKPVAAKGIYNSSNLPDVPLKPGMNEVSRANPNRPSQTDGVSLYVASNGDITGVIGWTETERPTGGRIKRVSDAWNWQDPSGDRTPVMKETSKVMRDYRVDKGFDFSNSSMSVGAQKSGLRRLNSMSWVGRQYSELGVFDLKSTLRDITTGFLDHIGFVAGDIHIDPSEIIDRIGIKRAQQVKGAPKEPPAMAGIGKSIKNVERARDAMPEVGGTTRGGVGFQAKAGVPLEAEGKPLIGPDGEPIRGTSRRKQSTAREAIAAETKAGHVSEVESRQRRRANDPLIFPESLSFDELVDSFMKTNGFHPELKPVLKQHLEFSLGEVLGGNHNTLDLYTDKRTATTWRSFIDDTEKARVSFDKAMAEPDLSKREAQLNDARKLLGLDNSITDPELNFQIQEAEKTKTVLEARVKQLENPVPLDLGKEDLATIKDLKEKAQAERQKAALDLMHLAHTANMFVERSYDGSVYLRDMDSHKKISESFRTEAEATQWVRDTGGARGIDMDGGSADNLIPPSVVGDIVPPQMQGPRPIDQPYEFTADTWFGKISSYFDRAVPWLSGKRATFTAYDNGFGTKFYSEVYEPLANAKMVTQAKKQPHKLAIKGVEDVLKASGIERKDWGRVGDYRNTMSVADIDIHVFGDRVPTQIEKDMSEKLANMHIDTKSVYEYVADVNELKKNARTAEAQLNPNAPDTPQRQQAIQKQLADDLTGLQTDANMDTNHLSAAQMFEYAQTQGRDKFRLDVTTRRANSIMGKEMSRSEYAKHHKMSAAELKAAKMLDSHEANLLAEAGLSPSFRDYVQHQLHEGQILDPETLDVNEKGTAGAAAKFVGNGEIGLSERDPILNAVNLTNRLIDHRYFDGVWSQANAAMREHLLSMPKPARDLAARVAGEYVFGLRGIPSAEEGYAKVMVRSFFDDIGLTDRGKLTDKIQEQVINDFSNTLLSASSSALVGFRPAQGLRDLHGFMRNYYTRFGGARTANGFRLAFERNPATGRLPIYELAEAGTIPGLSILGFLSEQEVADAMAGAGKHAIRDTIQKMAKAGITVSGQHNIYGIAHAVAYLESRQFNGKIMLELSRGEITREQAYKRMKLDTYDIPVGEAIDELVRQGKFNEATEHLAHATGTETAFVFGQQNQPLGWGSGFGRIMGHLGQWSIWDRDFLTRVASRGSASQRYAAMARFAASESALWAGGRATGINVTSWYALPGVLFTGSPILGMANQVSDMMGMRGQQKQKQSLRVYGGRVPILSQFMPGASAFSDYFQAYQLSQQRYGPVPIMEKAAGFSIDRTQRSWLDEMTDQYPLQQ